MKKIFILGIIILSSITSLWAQSQRSQHQRGSGNSQRFQMQLIIKQLVIKESDQASFEEIYTRYSSDMKKLRPKAMRKGKTDELSEEEVEVQILESFDRAQRTTSLKKEYYEEFKRILSPKQILRMYNIERKFNERLNSEVQSRGAAAAKR